MSVFRGFAWGLLLVAPIWAVLILAAFVIGRA